MKRSKLSSIPSKKEAGKLVLRRSPNNAQIFDEHNIMAKLDEKEFRAEQCYSKVVEEVECLQYCRDAYQVSIKFRSEKQKYRDHVRHTSGMDFYHSRT